MADNKLANRLADVRKAKPDGLPGDTSSPPPATRMARKGKAPVGERWEDTHRRATFHLPNELIDELTAFCASTNRSKGEVVRSALEGYIR